MIGKTYRRAQNVRHNRKHEGTEEYSERRELREEIPMQRKPSPVPYNPALNALFEARKGRP